jgi:thymidylate synthase (FAD)
MQVINQSYQILTKIDNNLIMSLIELAGRTAYKSEDKITESSSKLFIEKILKLGHESVIEHYNLTIKFITDRGITHEIVRHRLVSYTQESTRYCNYSKKGITFIKPVFWNIDSFQYNQWEAFMGDCEVVYNTLIENYSTPQEARSVLPNSLKTEIICTANIREWRHILKLRTSSSAHPQMRALMLPLLKELKEKLPTLFEDIKEKKETF